MQCTHFVEFGRLLLLLAGEATATACTLDRTVDVIFDLNHKINLNVVMLFPLQHCTIECGGAVTS